MLFCGWLYLIFPTFLRIFRGSVNIQEKSNEIGRLMITGLHTLKEKHDIIGDVRGQGLMIGVELVMDASFSKL